MRRHTNWTPACLIVACAVPASAQTTWRATTSSSGIQGNGPSLGPGAIAAGGRYIAYTGNASNLVAGDTNGSADAFVHDLMTHSTSRASVSSSGVQGNAASTDPRLSADGRLAAFISTATNLVAGDTNASDDVFVHDLQTGVTSRASVSSAGLQANSDSELAVLSRDGRFVVFSSFASNLVAGDTNGVEDVFVRDLQSSTTVRASLAGGSTQGDGNSYMNSISADGRFVAFASDATNLVAGDGNGKTDVFVRDLVNATTVRVSVDSLGAQGNDRSNGPSISADGTLVAFRSWANDLVLSDTNAAADTFVHDLVSGATERVSVDSSGLQGNAASVALYGPAISGDGRYVAFSSNASNLVSGDTNNFSDVFVRDRWSGTTTRASLGASGAQGNGHCSPTLSPSISDDGRWVGFDSGASNLVAGDTNGSWDVFARERWPATPVAYCTSGTSSAGCVATIGASAEPNLAHATPCVITVASVDGQRTGIVFYGLEALAQPWCSGGGASFLCVKPPTQRTAPTSTSGTAGLCDGALVLDWNAFQLAQPGALGSPWSAGAKAYVQGWFRDPPSCKTTTLSDALELSYQP